MVMTFVLCQDDGVRQVYFPLKKGVHDKIIRNKYGIHCL